jgi:hypothetical protein
MSTSKDESSSFLSRFIAGLRFPWLVAIAAGVLALNMILADPIPFADEILLAVGTALLASFRKKPQPDT